MTEDPWVRPGIDHPEPRDRRPESVELSNLVLSATMGNFARLRHLHLRDRVVTPAELWPGFTGDGFTGHARFRLGELDREDGAAVVTATPDEPDPVAAAYVEGAHDHGRYMGRFRVVPDGVMKSVSRGASPALSGNRRPGGGVLTKSVSSD